MGIMIDGKWHLDDPARTDKSGRFVRRETTFRHQVTADGSTGFRAESGRYHLYVSLACPWAHRTLILRKLMGLERALPVSVVHYHLGDDGWSFDDGPGVVPDTVNGTKYLRDIYLKAQQDYTGRVSVPVLWDKQTGTIVNNESREIVRMLDLEFGTLTAKRGPYLPADRKAEVDAMIERNQLEINNGVYRCGFSKSQPAYDEAVAVLFSSLDRCEAILGRQRYLCGNQITEADWCLFPTLVRFDPVYVTHFKCNVRRLVDYPNLWNYTKELYQVPGVAETVNLEHIKKHYFGSHTFINPAGIVPTGPLVDFAAPHDRAQRKYAA